MKKLLLRLCFVATILSSNNAISQAPDWTPIFLQPTGNNVVNGVEGYFQRGICGMDEVVFIKFVNTNNYAVILHWYNAIFTQDITWVHHADDTKTLNVPAASTLTGACGSEVILIVKLSEFISDPAQFKRYGAIYFNVTSSTN